MLQFDTGILLWLTMDVISPSKEEDALTGVLGLRRKQLYGRSNSAPIPASKRCHFEVAYEACRAPSFSAAAVSLSAELATTCNIGRLGQGSAAL